jgi:RNA polymerase sigma-70 factor (ECF subfamily)
MAVGQSIAVEAIQPGAQVAFDDIFASYQERIYNCVYRLMGNSEDAFDLTQETFLRAYAALPKINGEL